MSGRKRAEVESVLKHAARLQHELFGRRLDQAAGTLGALDAMEGADRSLMHEARQRIVEVKRKLDQLGSEMDGLYDRIREREEDSDGLERDWFFDEEYAEAKRLNERFHDLLRQQVHPLNHQLERHLELLKAEAMARERMERDLAEARAALDMLASRMEGFTLNHPLQPDETVTLERFCNELGNGSRAWSALTAELTQAYAALESEDCERALCLARTAGKRLDELLEFVDMEYQQMQYMVTTARELGEALYDLGFKVDSELMGGRLADGLRVKTVETERLAEFEFSMGEEGEAETEDGDAISRVRMAFNVDRMGGSCHASTEALMKRLRKAGIRMQVTDWGEAPDAIEVSPACQKEKRKQ